MERRSALWSKVSLYIQKSDCLNTLIHLSSSCGRYQAKGKRRKKAQHYFTKYQVSGNHWGVCVRLSHKVQRKEAYFLYIYYTHKSKSFPQADYYWHNIQLNVSLMTLSFWDSEVTSLFSSLEVPPFCAFPPTACLSVKSRDLHVIHSSHVFPTVIKHPDLLKTI